MSIRTNVKNIELFIFNNDENFDFADLETDENILTYLDAQVTAGTITNIRKLSGDSNELTVEPQEDDIENKKHFGSDTNGAQNSDTIITTNTDVDITLNIESSIQNDLNDYILKQITATGTDALDSDYKRYNLGSYATDSYSLYFKIEKLINGVYYYKNIVIKNPIAKTPQGISSSADDSSINGDYAFLGKKTNGIYDEYNRASKQVSANFN